jgi:hypothetical protein
VLLQTCSIYRNFLVLPHINTSLQEGGQIITWLSTQADAPDLASQPLHNSPYQEGALDACCPETWGKVSHTLYGTDTSNARHPKIRSIHALARLHNDKEQDG